MDSGELSERLRGLYDALHRLANPPFKIGAGEMKRELRSLRDQVEQLAEEATSDANWRTHTAL